MPKVVLLGYSQGLIGGSNLWKTHFEMSCEEREIQERIEFLKEIGGNEKS